MLPFALSGAILLAKTGDYFLRKAVLTLPLVNMGELLNEARKGDWAVGSFSVANMEMVMGVLMAAEEKESPEHSRYKRDS